MSGNRVEELEEKVRELEATIEGLTDELVETKERLEAVEDETGVEPDGIRRSGRSVQSQSQAAGQQPETTADDDAADDVNNDEAGGDDNTDSESGDDIIVA